MNNMTAEVLKRLKRSEIKARQENRGAIVVLDRRSAEKLFSNEKNNLSRKQFDGRVMRTVRKLHSDGYFVKLTRGMYAFTGYGRRISG